MTMRRFLTATLSALAGTVLLCAQEPRTFNPGSPDGVLMGISEAQQKEVRVQMPHYFWHEGHTLDTQAPAELKSIQPIPSSGIDGVSYGIVPSRNEFGISRGYFKDPSSDRVAFYKVDERSVTEFPLLDIKGRTGSLKAIRYPMNGMASQKVSLEVFGPMLNKECEIKVSDFDDERYLTEVTWSPDGKYIFIQVLDRAQHEMHLNQYDSHSGEFIRTILTEQDDRWVEPLDPLYFLKDSYLFIYRTNNRDGYRNLYLCDTLGNVRRLTQCDADVDYVANDGRWVYYTSAEVSPVENHLFRIEVTQKKSGIKFGKPQRLTTERGWHDITVSPDLTEFLDRWSNFETPGVIQEKSCDGKLIKELFRAENPLTKYKGCEIEFGTVKSADGRYDNAYRLFKPAGFDPGKKYPLILYVYGGPHSQMVQDRWLAQIRMWEYAMAQRGYVVYVQDNRGTFNQGAEYEKAVNRNLGKVEMEDQMVGVRRLIEQPWIDSARVGVHGWSYGGFMTISLMTSYPDIFKVGVAGGPVIDWKWYEIMYGERYMDNPETNPDGFAATSLIGKAKNLQGHRLLICQGMLDNTVVPEHSFSFVQDCIENAVPVDYFPYPLDEHNMIGKARLHLYEKISDYFLTFL